DNYTSRLNRGQVVLCDCDPLVVHVFDHLDRAGGQAEVDAALEGEGTRTCIVLRDDWLVANGRYLLGLQDRVDDRPVRRLVSDYRGYLVLLRGPRTLRSHIRAKLVVTRDYLHWMPVDAAIGVNRHSSCLGSSNVLRGICLWPAAYVDNHQRDWG